MLDYAYCWFWPYVPLHRLDLRIVLYERTPHSQLDPTVGM